MLRAIDPDRPVSQGEIARAMNVDRTTMVALVDDLQLKGLVQRRPDLDDRRKNVVELTDAGRSVVRQAAKAGEQAERDFLGPLSAAEAAQFKKMLRVLLERAEPRTFRLSPGRGQWPAQRPRGSRRCPQ